MKRKVCTLLTARYAQRSFVVVVVVVLGVESKAKHVSNGKKNVREQNLYQIEQKLLWMCVGKIYSGFPG